MFKWWWFPEPGPDTLTLAIGIPGRQYTNQWTERRLSESPIRNPFTLWQSSYSSNRNRSMKSPPPGWNSWELCDILWEKVGNLSPPRKDPHTRDTLCFSLRPTWHTASPHRGVPLYAKSFPAHSLCTPFPLPLLFHFRVVNPVLFQTPSRQQLPCFHWTYHLPTICCCHSVVSGFY